MANSHGRLIHVDMCDRSESSITNTGAFAFSRLFLDRAVSLLLALWSGSAGQRRVCLLLGVCPHSLAVLIFVSCGTVSYLAL